MTFPLKNGFVLILLTDEDENGPSGIKASGFMFGFFVPGLQ